MTTPFVMVVTTFVMVVTTLSPVGKYEAAEMAVPKFVTDAQLQLDTVVSEIKEQRDTFKANVMNDRSRAHENLKRFLAGVKKVKPDAPPQKGIFTALPIDYEAMGNWGKNGQAMTRMIKRHL